MSQHEVVCIGRTKQVLRRQVVAAFCFGEIRSHALRPTGLHNHESMGIALAGTRQEFVYGEAIA